MRRVATSCSRRSTSTRTRDQPGVPGAVDPCGVRDQGGQLGRRVHGRRTPSTSCRSSSTSCCRATPDRDRRLIAVATRRACAPRSSRSRRTKTSSSRSPNCSSPTGRGPEALEMLARIPESDRTRHIAAAARVGVEPHDDYDDELDRAARQGQGRRRRPPAFRRHPRADGVRRSAHRRVPPPADQPPVLTPVPAAFVVSTLRRRSA